MTDEIGPQMAVIVCKEVAEGAAILFAMRTEPLRDADSGWQFLCGAATEDETKAQVWAVHEVLEQDESLSDYMEFPVGTVLRRSSPGEDWTVSYEAPE